MSCIGSVRYNIGLKCKYAKILLNAVSLCKTMRRNAILNKKTLMPSISTTLSGVISHAELFLPASSRLRNPWQTLAEPLGSTELQLKITAILYLSCDCQHPLNGTIYGREILHADPCSVPGHWLGEMLLRGCPFEKILPFLKLCSHTS